MGISEPSRRSTGHEDAENTPDETGPSTSGVSPEARARMRSGVLQLARSAAESKTRPAPRPSSSDSTQASRTLPSPRQLTYSLPTRTDIPVANPRDSQYIDSELAKREPLDDPVQEAQFQDNVRRIRAGDPVWRAVVDLILKADADIPRTAAAEARQRLMPPLHSTRSSISV